PTPGKPTPPRLVTYADPAYPTEAQAAGLEGAVGLQLDIDATGKVTAATVVDPAGHGFDEAATEAAYRLVFEPARRANGEPAPARILYRFTFTLTPAQPDTPDGPAPPPGVPEPLGGQVLADVG